MCLAWIAFSKGEAAQTKLIRVVTGAVLDVIVDIRKGVQPMVNGKATFYQNIITVSF